MKKTVFFNKNYEEGNFEEMNETKEIRTEVKIENKVRDEGYIIRKNTDIMDKGIVKYVIDNFPVMGDEIKDALKGLTETLERTIDYIEDRSSEEVKKNRDFELSQAHRNKSIQIYDKAKEIYGYMNWMEEVKNPEKKDDNKYDDGKKNEIDPYKLGEERAINKDFTGKEPVVFQLDNYVVEVESWEDLTVKLAEVLTKNYKDNKNSDILVNQSLVLEEKKSLQNDMRDSVIDILNDYKIDVSHFKVFVK